MNAMYVTTITNVENAMSVSGSSVLRTPRVWPGRRYYTTTGVPMCILLLYSQPRLPTRTVLYYLAGVSSLGATAPLKALAPTLCNVLDMAAVFMLLIVLNPFRHAAY